MRKKIIITAILLASYIYCLYFIFFKQTVGLSNDLVFAIISTSSIFVLPAIISKLITKKSYFGIGYVLSTLIYPLSYLLIYSLSKWLEFEPQTLYRALAYLFLTFTIFSLIFLLFKRDLKNYVSLKRSFVIYLGVFSILLGIYVFLHIKTDALLSTDFLQHNAVAKEMANGKLCLTPNQCSNLFQKLGYTTYFHSIQVFITTGFNLNTGIASTIFNFSLIASFAVLIAKILNRYFRKKSLVLLGILISIMVFETGAYSFAFIIPQTFVLFLFLNILSERKFKLSSLLFVIPILLANHFIFGPIFSAFAFIYYLFHQKFKKDSNTLKVLSMISFLGVIVALLANMRGFSIEKFFQLSDIGLLGSFTNYYFPQNLSFLFAQYGFLIILFIISTIFIFIKKKSVPFAYYSITYVSLCLMFFFLAPTYASKFLIGSSGFMAFSTIYMINSLRFNKWIQTITLLLILLSSLPFYLSNFKNYLTFYTQNTGVISGRTQDDTSLIQYLSKKKNLECQIVSDPYTQLVVRGETLFETAEGQYQGLDTRKAIAEFIAEPNDKTYENMIVQYDIDSRFCFLYTSRIESAARYINPENIPWINNLYDYEINNNYGVYNQDLVDLLLNKGFHIIYSDSNNILFSRE